MIQMIAVPAFTDNYIWLITNQQRKYAAIVDPGSAGPVIEELKEREIQPEAILITHYHQDHVGGIAKLLEAYPGTPVYGPAKEFIPHITRALSEGDVVSLPEVGISLGVMDVPGHTAGHIAYYGDGNLFCGDTLFGSGCGRVFDGSLEDLYCSLRRIASLPPETVVYCTHEYTVDNLGFARWVEPNNPAIDERLQACWDLLDAGRPTVPFLLDGEFETNPFLRTHIPEVISKAEEVAGRETQTTEDVFAVLRIWKDSEYD